MPFSIPFEPPRGLAVPTFSLLSATSSFSILSLLSLYPFRIVSTFILSLLVRSKHAALRLLHTFFHTTRMPSGILCEPRRGAAALTASLYPLPLHRFQSPTNLSSFSLETNAYSTFWSTSFSPTALTLRLNSVFPLLSALCTAVLRFNAFACYFRRHGQATQQRSAFRLTYPDGAAYG